MGQTHFDAEGNAVMADVSGKEITLRIAVAGGEIRMNEQSFRAVYEGAAAKGDVLGAARVAGIMAAKRTAELIPLCHPLAIDTCSVDFSLQPDQMKIEAVCTVKTTGKTGVEMEALTGAAVALLTIYDMCKSLDRAMVIERVRLYEKSGGKSGHFINDETL